MLLKLTVLLGEVLESSQREFLVDRKGIPHQWQARGPWDWYRVCRPVCHLSIHCVVTCRVKMPLD